jgi:hypothetical protein
MTPAAVSWTVHLVLAPVVMITKCGMIFNRMLVWHAATSTADRMRGVACEHLERLWG